MSQDVTKVNVLGVSISNLGLSEVLDRIGQAAVSKGKSVFENVNIHALNMAYENEWLRNFYNQCEVVYCDGVGVKLAAWLLGSPIRERFTPPDWMPLLAAQCMQAKRSIFFLGGRDGVAKQAADQLIVQCPGLRVAGTHHGFFDKNVNGEENRKILQLINQSSPDVLVVGFGIPIQEKWILENMLAIDVPVILVTGAMFDYISGSVPRGPRWMTNNGLEWLSRLLVEPRRLWKRYLFGIPSFFFKVVKQRLGLLTHAESKA